MSEISAKDKKVQDLIAKANKKKAEIAKAEKGKYETNASFRFDPNSSVSMNLHTVSNVGRIVDAYAHLLTQKGMRETAAKELGVESSFEWLGYTIDEWKNDFQTRITKINLKKEKEKLDALETKLNGLVSKEMREAMELAEIEKMLED